MYRDRTSVNWVKLVVKRDEVRDEVGRYCYLKEVEDWGSDDDVVAEENGTICLSTTIVKLRYLW